MNELSKIIKTISIIGLMIGFATAFGVTLSTLIPWQWLTIVFIILRKLILFVDFGIDTNAIFVIISLWLNILLGYWIFLGADWIIARLRTK